MGDDSLAHKAPATEATAHDINDPSGYDSIEDDEAASPLYSESSGEFSSGESFSSGNDFNDSDLFIEQQPSKSRNKNARNSSTRNDNDNSSDAGRSFQAPINVDLDGSESEL
ncbi:hypothetical protein KEM55_002301 [Ascosphaera atra]|nr:hypothetical protein KEM55_002301 [Ascosphaera atra]